MRKSRVDGFTVIQDIGWADRGHMVLARRHADDFPELGPDTARWRRTTTHLWWNVPMGERQWRSGNMVRPQMLNPDQMVLRLPKKTDRYCATSHLMNVNPYSNLPNSTIDSHKPDAHERLWQCNTSHLHACSCIFGLAASCAKFIWTHTPPLMPHLHCREPDA